MKIRKLFITLISLLFILATLISCTSNSKTIIINNEKNNKNVTKITFFGYKADDLNLIAIEKALHLYMEEHDDVSVVYEGVKGKSYWNALELRYKTNNLDDVIMVDQGRLMSMGNDLADLKDVVDLDMFNDLVKEQIIKVDGKILFIPINLSSYCLYINYDMLKADGQSIPTNLPEFRQICNYYVNQKHITPIICNNNNSLRTIVEACSLYDVYQQDKNINIETFNENPSLLGSYLAEGISLIGEMIDSKWIDKDITKVTTQTEGDIEEFVKGKNPFMITGGWVSLRIKDKLAKLGKTMNFGVHPYPVRDDGGVLLVNITTCISVNANSKNVDKAKNFVSYFVNPDFIWDYCDSQCCFSPLKNETRIPKETSVAPTAEYYTNGRAVIGADFRLKVPLDLYLTECTMKMLDGMSVDEANSYILDLLEGKQTI